MISVMGNPTAAIVLEYEAIKVTVVALNVTMYESYWLPVYP
jgi:hypothetical protein